METSEIDNLFAANGPLARNLPGFESRECQVRMARQVFAAVREERSLIIEAGTGTGKTFSYLLPIMAMGVRAVISTATRALQDQIINKDIPLARRALSQAIDAVVLKGRANYLCRHRFRAFQYQPRLFSSHDRQGFAMVSQWAMETQSGDRDELAELPEEMDFWPSVSSGSDNCLGRECQDFADCFLFRARERAQKARLVVVNHHLFFADLAVKAGNFGEILPDFPVAIFDEAHQVPDVVTQFFGITLSSFQLRELARDGRREFEMVKGEDPLLFSRFDRLEDVGALLRGVFPDGDDRQGLGPEHLNGPCGQALNEVDKALEALLEALEPHRARSAGLAACGRRGEEMLMASATVRALDDPSRVYWYESRGRGVYLRVSPLSTGPELKKSLYPRIESAIFTSATLATADGAAGFDYIRGQLGLQGEEAQVERLPPAFDYARQSLLFLPLEMPDPNSDGFPQAVVAMMLRILAASRGRALCLFTSHRMLKEAREGLAGRTPYTLLTQGERSKGALLAQFRSEYSSVLLATAAFWEGVDVPGEALSAVIIDKLPFASPGDPLVAARARHLESLGQNPFSGMHLPRAVLTLKQGAGRLIRTLTDRGVLSVLDNRIMRRSYGRAFVRGLAPMPVTHDIHQVHRFFAGKT